MLVRTRDSTDPTIAEAPRQGLVWKDVWNFVHDRHIRRNRTALSSTYFSTGYPGSDLVDHEWVSRADILHLHWVSDFLSPASLGALLTLGKPIVWTLHDLRAFTGGCHFSAGCTGYERDCSPCPQLRRDRLALTRRNLQDQQEILSGENRLLVTPSRWLAQCARQSAVLGKVRAEVIPYGCDTAAYYPVSKCEARRALGIASDAFCVAFGAHYANEKRKGAAELATALRVFGERRHGNDKALLLAFGRFSDGIELPRIEVRSLGYVRDETQLRTAYAAADVFVLPSLEDNLPNTMIEALACGTPVVAFAVGGIPEVIRDGVNGRLVAAGDTMALANVLLELAADRERCARMGSEGARLIAAEYTLGIQAARYTRLYRGLTSSSPRFLASRRFGRRIGAVVPALIAEWLVLSGVRQHWALLRRALGSRS